jgi:hypothetical protein
VFKKTISLSDFTTSGGEVAEDQFVQDVNDAIPARTVESCTQDFVNVYLVFDAALTAPEETALASVVTDHTAVGRITVGLVAALTDGLFADEDGYATNGRKVGEGGGAGTGVPIYWSQSAWRVFSTDAAVQA